MGDWKEELINAVSRRFEEMEYKTYADVVDLFERRFQVLFHNKIDNEFIKINRSNGTIDFKVFEYGLSLSNDFETEVVTVSKIKNGKLHRLDQLENSNGYYPIESEKAEGYFAEALYELWQPIEVDMDEEEYDYGF